MARRVAPRPEGRFFRLWGRLLAVLAPVVGVEPSHQQPPKQANRAPSKAIWEYTPKDSRVEEMNITLASELENVRTENQNSMVDNKGLRVHHANESMSLRRFYRQRRGSMGEGIIPVEVQAQGAGPGDNAWVYIL